MTRRIVLDLDQDMVDYLTSDRVTRRAGHGTHEVDRLVGAARAAVTGPQIDLCPTCQGWLAKSCDRCFGTGRLHLAKITVSPTTDGRAVLELWQGAPGSWWPMAATATGKDLSSDGIDGLLASLQTGGLIVDDRRAR